MIEEIVKLREDGLSFRKIATELNTTVGRVQYRWNKWISRQEKSGTSKPENIVEEATKSPSEQQSYDIVPIKGELQAKLVSPRKILLYWDVSKIPERLLSLFFNEKLEELVHLVRVYDVTDIIFNGKNAHHFYDVAVPYQKGFWFIKGLTANRSYIAELGVKLNNKEFFPLFRSNFIQTPTLELLNGSEIYYHLVSYHQLEEYSPKWAEHVSTYSYYGEPINAGQKDEQ